MPKGGRGALFPSHLQRTGWPFQKSSSREVCLLQPAICSQLLSQLPLPVWSLLPQLGGGGDRLPLGAVLPGNTGPRETADRKWSLKAHSLHSPVCSLPSRPSGRNSCLLWFLRGGQGPILESAGRWAQGRTQESGSTSFKTQPHCKT